MPTLHWLSRADDLKTAGQTEYKLLVENPAFGYGDKDSGNFLIQGDNLAALKSLLPFYAGQVKCVYIDPPYNTGSAFEHYDDNLEHAKWLALIYPRMELLRELLAEDGSIWISIDDDESHYLKIICDEIFGRNNFVNNVIWEKKFSPQNDAKWLSDNHDHILVYAKTKEIWRPNLLPRTEEMAARYTNWDNDPRGVWSSSDLTAQDPFEYGQYEITTPGGKTYLPGNNRHWIYAKEKFMQLQKDNRIWFGESGNNKPRLKKFLYEIQSGMVPLTLWKHTEVGHNQEAKKEINTLFGVTSAFDTPKPERLIQRILQLATKENDLVLDSFLGSGTTAAVAHKMGRKYIGIEIGEQAKTHCIPRLKKVIDGEQGGISRSVGWQGGGGFRFFTLGAPVFDENGRIHTDIIFDQLAARLSQNPDRRR